MKKFTRNALAGAIAMVLGTASVDASAFCGFFAGKADAKLFNDASQVIMARAGERTVITMLNDYAGPLQDFALAVPVPEVLPKDAIKVVDKAVFERVEAWSAPRLAEYFDPDPCARRLEESHARGALPMAQSADRKSVRDQALGVKVEAKYTVGEYDIVILSAAQSDGLETWLKQNGYRLPAGTGRALRPYIKQGLKFFVARVNLKEQATTGVSFLRPLQFAFNSERFMLPIRLGMVNARGPQDLVIYMLTRQGRVETTNYRTVKLPANMDLPVNVRHDFGSVYKALFAEQVRREDMHAVFTEYFWDMGWCDPCAADPLSAEELKNAGVTWLDGKTQPVMLTRLHVRYSRETFPEDLMFQETRDRANYQARYVLRHAWKGNPDACPGAAGYLEGVARREEREAQTLANLTGWSVGQVRARAGNMPGRVVESIAR